MMLITMLFNILRVCIGIYISHHFVFPLLVTKLPLKGYSMTVFQVKCFTDHNSHFFTELLFPEKQNLFSTYINQSFNFTFFFHTMTNSQYLLTYQTFITTQQVVFLNLPIDKEDLFLYTQFSTHHLPLSLVNYHGNP